MGVEIGQVGASTDAGSSGPQTGAGQVAGPGTDRESTVDGASVDASSLCVGCGLCCDGTLLSHLAVSDESDLGAPLRALGVAVIVEADPPVFALPCPALAGGVCSVHDLHRPHACQQFECALADAVREGSLTTEVARSVIADTIVLRDDVAGGRASEVELERQLDRWFRPR